MNSKFNLVLILLLIVGCTTMTREEKIRSFCSNPANGCVDITEEGGMVNAKGYEAIPAKEYEDQVTRQLEEFCEPWWRCLKLLPAEYAFIKPEHGDIYLESNSGDDNDNPDVPDDSGGGSNPDDGSGGGPPDGGGNDGGNDGCDTGDGNNGHGNDPGGVDGSNPGNSTGVAGPGQGHGAHGGGHGHGGVK